MGCWLQLEVVGTSDDYFFVIELVRTFWTVRQWEIKNFNFHSLASSLALVFTIQIHWCILLACWDLPNVYGVLIAIGGGGDIWWLFYVIELVRTFLNCKMMGNQKLQFFARSLALVFTIQIHWCILLTCWDLPNVYGVRIAIGGGGDIWWLFYVIELVRTFWTVWQWEIKNFNFRSLAHSRFHHSNTLVYLTRLLRPPKCIWGADCNWRLWWHLMTILCNRTRSNFLNCKTMENQKLKFSLAHSLASSLSLTRSLSFSPFKYIGVSYSLAETSQMYMGCWLQLEVVGTSDDYFM